MYIIYRCGRDYCDAKEIMSIADAMATNGMKDMGYEYINFDGISNVCCNYQTWKCATFKFNGPLSMILIFRLLG